jgi:hypothetical protein
MSASSSLNLIGPDEVEQRCRIFDVSWFVLLVNSIDFLLLLRMLKLLGLLSVTRIVGMSV